MYYICINKFLSVFIYCWVFKDKKIDISKILTSLLILIFLLILQKSIDFKNINKKIE